MEAGAWRWQCARGSPGRCAGSQDGRLCSCPRFQFSIPHLSVVGRVILSSKPRFSHQRNGDNDTLLQVFLRGLQSCV